MRKAAPVLFVCLLLALITTLSVTRGTTRFDTTVNSSSGAPTSNGPASAPDKSAAPLPEQADTASQSPRGLSTESSAGDLGLELRAMEIPKRNLPVRVKGPTGQAVRAMVWLEDNRLSQPGPNHLTDESGYVLLEDMPREPFVMHAWPLPQDDVPVWPNPDGITVNVDATSVDVAFAEGVWVTGEVIAADSSSVAKMFVEVFAGDKLLAGEPIAGPKFRLVIPKDTAMPVIIRAKVAHKRYEYSGEAEMASTDRFVSIEVKPPR